MNINHEIQIATDKVVAEKMPEMIEAAVTTMTKNIVDETFRSYGDVAKMVKKKLE